MKELKGVVFVIISAVIFGCMPMAAKYLYAEGCNSISLVVYRYSLALPLLFFMALREQRGGRKKGGKKTGGGKKEEYAGGAAGISPAGLKSETQETMVSLKREMKITLYQMQQFLILSAGFALTPVLLFTSYNYISSGSATTIHFSYPVFVILASILLFKEKATVTKAAAVLFCLIGLILFYEPGQEGGMLGLILALASGVTYTFYMMFFDRSTLKLIKPFKMNFYLSLISAGLVFVFSLVSGSFVLLNSARGWIMALGFSFMLTVVACVLFQMGIAMIGAQKTAVLSTFEPITSVVIGVVCFQESVGIKTGLGVLFILAAVLSITLFDKKQ